MRKPRMYEEGIYYITVKGNQSEMLFKEPDDYEYFLTIMKSRKEKYNFKLYGYCLMDNFYHILIEPGAATNISKIMQALNTSYALYYNKKYNHIGHIVAGRFEGKLVERDPILITFLRRLHLMPLQARLVKDIADYKWNSYPEYLGVARGLADTEYIKSFGYHPQADREYVLATARHVSLFKRHYLVPAATLALLFFLVIFQGKKGDGPILKNRTVPFFVSLPDGLPQPQLAKQIYTGKAVELPVGAQR